MLRHAFTVLGADAVFAGHNPRNAASRRTLLKLGFRYTHDEFYPPTGLMHPSYVLPAGAWGQPPGVAQVPAPS